MNYSTGLVGMGQSVPQAIQNSPNAPPTISALDEIRSKLALCHETVSGLHGIADRACGIRGEQKEGAPSPVPNGLLDDVLDMVSALNMRLNTAAARLSRVA